MHRSELHKNLKKPTVALGWIAAVFGMQTMGAQDFDPFSDVFMDIKPMKPDKLAINW